MAQLTLLFLSIFLLNMIVLTKSLHVERIPRILRHGLAVAELAENDLPGVPSAVFAFKEVSELPL